VSAAAAAALDALPAFGRRRLEVVRQSEITECGLACLAMVLSAHGTRVSLPALRARYPVSLKGTSARQIMAIAADFGLLARTVRAELSALSRLSRPSVLHWGLNHFVVLEAVGRGSVTIVDPALGRRRLSLAEVSKQFTGIALEFAPSADYRRVELNTRLRLQDVIRQFRGLTPGLLVVLALSLGGALLQLLAPQFIQFAIDYVIVDQDIELLVILGIAFALAKLFQTGLEVLRDFALTHLRAGAFFQLAQNLFRHLLALPLIFFESRAVGDLLSKFQGSEQIEETITTEAINTVVSGVLSLVTGVLICLYSLKLALLVALVVLLNLAVRLAYYPALRQRLFDGVVAQAAAEGRFIEFIRGNQSVKALGAEDIAFGHWVRAYAEAANAKLRFQQLSIWQKLPQGLVEIVDGLAVPGLAVYLIIEGELTLGMFYAFNVYRGSFVQAMDALIETLFKLRYNAIHLERLSDIALQPTERQHLARPEAVPAAAGARPLPPAAGAALLQVEQVELQQAGFAFPGSGVALFEAVDLAIRRGEMITLLGASGSGKTTLLKCLASLLWPDRGRLVVNGGPLEPGGLAGYRARIGIVMQNDRLFAGSVATNVAYCDEAIDMDRVASACELADIHAEILAMPMRYETLIGDMGSALSTGQQQRIILARALYRRPDLLFLDEGLAHIDAAAEQRILARLRKLGAGVVLVSHGTASLAISDRIYALIDRNLVQQPK
jgi:ATP-binding cassette subfamily B protein RaxB